MKTTIISLGLAALLGAAACGGSGSKTETMPADTTGGTADTTAPAAGAGMQLKLAEMTLYHDTTPILKIHADGTTELAAMAAKPKDGSAPAASWQPGPTIKSDGTFSMNGEDVARIEADGTLRNLKSNDTIKFDVGQDSLSVTDGSTTVTLHLAEDGTLTVEGGPKTMTARVEGATDEGTRRTALVVAASMFLASQPHQTAPEAGPAAPAQPVPAPAPAPAK